MTGLRELFEEATCSSPPSRLMADEVYATGRRRRRRRLTAATCAAATALAVIVMVGINLLAPLGPPVDGPPTTDATTLAEIIAGRPIQWAGAADATHLYLTYSTCTGSPCKTIVQLAGSDDGGRTWSDRGAPTSFIGLAVIDPDTLIAAVLDAAATTLMTSTDGGRSWAAAQRAQPVYAVPSGATVICWRDTGAQSCSPHAVDPAAQRIMPLTEQPPLIMNTDELTIAESDGRLWLRGTDPATGRPAVALSRDAGRTWSTHVFTDAPPCAREGCEAPSLAVGDGGTAYAVVTGAQDRAVYRQTNGAGATGWQRIASADHVPFVPGANGSFITADGTHVLYQLEEVANRRAVSYQFWAARDGTYGLVELDGLPATAGPVRRTPDGWFYALSHTDGALYGSTDGWHWSPVPRP